MMGKEMETDFPVPTNVREYNYLTCIKGRTPARKMHETIGQAKNAVGYQYYNGARGGQIYAWVVFEDAPAGWELIYDIAPGTPVKQLPWKIEETTRKAEAAAAAKEKESHRRLLEARDEITRLIEETIAAGGTLDDVTDELAKRMAERFEARKASK